MRTIDQQSPVSVGYQLHERFGYVPSQQISACARLLSRNANVKCHVFTEWGEFDNFRFYVYTSSRKSALCIGDSGDTFADLLSACNHYAPLAR